MQAGHGFIQHGIAISNRNHCRHKFLFSQKYFSRFCLFVPQIRPILMENGSVTLKFRIVFLALIFAPHLVSAQFLSPSLSAHGSFDSATYKPLNGRERWQRWVSEDGASPAIYIESLTAAAYLQAIPDPATWNRTAGGFVRRLGSSYGSNLIQNTVQESTASIAGTDPRYFTCACSGFFHRSGHALKMTLLTYNRDGRETLDLPQITAAYGSSMIEVMWWPQHYTPLVQGVQTGHLEMGFIGAEHLVQEFAPELKRLLHLRF
jgi:hypothetical protein